MHSFPLRKSHARWGLGEVVAFVIPCLIFIEIKLVGRLFLSEIILFGSFPFLLLIRGRVLLEAMPRTLILLGLIWLLGQVVTDVIRSTPFEDYSRGWSKIIFLLLNFSAIYILLYKNKRRLMLFALGIATGQILQYFIDPNVYAAGGSVWKFGVGYAITFLVVLSTQLKAIYRINYLSGAVLIGAALMNFYLGFRSLGVFCFVTALFLVYQRILNTRKAFVDSTVRGKTVVAAISLGVLVGYIGIEAYGYGASEGWLGQEVKQKYELQSRGQFGIFLGGRPELLVSSLAVMESPIIGHGSWAKDPKYKALLYELLSQYGYKIENDNDSDLIPTHSYFFGAWVDSGVVGALFWFWVLLLPIKLLIVLRQCMLPLAVLLTFVAFSMIWNILFSPFGATGRVYAAYYIVLLMYGVNLVGKAKEVSFPRRKSRSA